MEFALSTEEMAVAFSLVNRPDLGKAVITEIFGELSASALEQRLIAASHSLLAGGYAKIGEHGIACIADELQSALTPLLLFTGMIQMALNAGEPQLINIHLGRNGAFTAHWVEQGVIHRLATGKQQNLIDWVAKKVAFPVKVPADFALHFHARNVTVSMETFATLPEMKTSDGLERLKEFGLSAPLAKLFLDDAHRPKCRGSITYVPVSSDLKELDQLEQPVAGLFFLKGKFTWILAFPKSLENQEAHLLPGTDSILREKVRELQERKENAFLS